jgi:glycosyltransferase involved in cell wall biosynthesis
MNHYDGVHRAEGVTANLIRHAFEHGIARWLARLRRVHMSLLVLFVAPIRCAGLLWHAAAIRARGRARIGARGAQGTPTIAMLVITDLTVDPRVQRGAKALARRGFRVQIICPSWTRSTDIRLDWGENVSFRILPPRRDLYVFPWLWDPALYQAARDSGAWAYHCHDLTTCVIGLAAATRTGAQCVCDFHEWYSENVTWSALARRFRRHPWHKRRLFRFAERLVLRYASAVIIVCESLAELLAREFGSSRPIHVVRNIPRFQSAESASTDLRASLGLLDDSFILLYQGSVGPSRYLEPIIEALAHVPEAVFVIRGPGTDQWRGHYRRVAIQAGVGDRVICLPPVSSDRVTVEAASADAGIWTLEDLCLNFRHALPNKVFEYLAAGLPILVSDYPETRRIVHDYDVGACFDPDSPRSIAQAIRSLAGDPERQARCRENTAAALRAMDPETEWMKLVEIYRGLAQRT